MPNDTAPNPKIQPISRVPSSTPQVKHGGQLARSSRQAGTTVASTQSATTASKASGQPKQIQVKLKPVKGSGTGGEMDEADITITLASRQDTPLLESPSPDHIWKKPDQETGKKERREQGMRWKSHTRDKRGSNGEPGPRRWRAIAYFCEQDLPFELLQRSTSPRHPQPCLRRPSQTVGTPKHPSRTWSTSSQSLLYRSSPLQLGMVAKRITCFNHTAPGSGESVLLRVIWRCPRF